MNSGADWLMFVVLSSKKLGGVIYNLFFLHALLFMLNLQYRDVH
jgi:hypothetical protein